MRKSMCVCSVRLKDWKEAMNKLRTAWKVCICTRIEVVKLRHFQEECAEDYH